MPLRVCTTPAFIPKKCWEQLLINSKKWLWIILKWSRIRFQTRNVRKKLQVDVIWAEKVRLYIMKHNDSDINLSHTCDRPIDQKDVLIIIMKQIYFAPDSEI